MALLFHNVQSLVFSSARLNLRSVAACSVVGSTFKMLLLLDEGDDDDLMTGELDDPGDADVEALLEMVGLVLGEGEGVALLFLLLSIKRKTAAAIMITNTTPLTIKTNLLFTSPSLLLLKYNQNI